MREQLRYTVKRYLGQAGSRTNLVRATLSFDVEHAQTEVHVLQQDIHSFKSY